MPFLIVRPSIIGGDVLRNLWMGIVASLLVSSLTLFLIGWYKSRITIGRPVRSGLQMVLIGIGSAFAGFGIAYIVSGGGIFP